MDKLHDKEIKVAQVKQAAATIVQKAKECMKVYVYAIVACQGADVLCAYTLGAKPG